MNVSNGKQSGDNPPQKTGPIDKPYQRICVPIDFVTKYFADATFPLTINLIVEADGKVIHGNQPTHITRNHNGAGRPYYFIRKLADVVSKSGLGRPQKFLWHLEPQQTIRVCLVACSPRDGDAGGAQGGAAIADDDDQPSAKKARQGSGQLPDSPLHQAINTQPNGVYPSGGHPQEGGTPRSSGGGGAGGASVGRSLLTRLEMEITIVLRELVAGNVGVEDLRHCMGVMAEQWAAAVDEAEKLRSDLAATRRSLDHTESALGRAQEHMSHQDSCTPAPPAVSLATEHLVKALQMLDPTALVTLGTQSDARAQ